MTAVIHTVDPARLLPGGWSHTENHQVGEGDISASYSGDVIALKGRVRKPFRFQSQLWVCVGLSGRDRSTAKAYRLIEAWWFEGTAVTYNEKTHGGEAARNDPSGFYHGVRVSRGGESYVLVGPSVEFVAGVQEQLDLF